MKTFFAEINKALPFLVLLIANRFYRSGCPDKPTDGQIFMSLHITEGCPYNAIILKPTSANLQGIIILFLKLHPVQHSPWVLVEKMSTL